MIKKRKMMMLMMIVMTKRTMKTMIQIKRGIEFVLELNGSV